MSPKPKPKPKPKAKPKPKLKPRESTGGFPAELAKLLRSRGLAVPRGLQSAPPEAYGNAAAAFADQLARGSDRDLVVYAERVAGYAARQAQRARAEWERSPLIRELRRRKLAEPPVPKRVVGASVGLTKPLSEWSDRELAAAAKEWARRASR
jgi:hypothetical protein